MDLLSRRPRLLSGAQGAGLSMLGDMAAQRIERQRRSRTCTDCTSTLSYNAELMPRWTERMICFCNLFGKNPGGARIVSAVAVSGPHCAASPACQ
eukprot:6205640-Pleurochrysis_carterae.AAC.4